MVNIGSILLQQTPWNTKIVLVNFFELLKINEPWVVVSSFCCIGIFVAMIYAGKGSEWYSELWYFLLSMVFSSLWYFLLSSETATNRFNSPALLYSPSNSWRNCAMVLTQDSRLDLTAVELPILLPEILLLVYWSIGVSHFQSLLALDFYFLI